MQNLDPETIRLINRMVGPAPSHPRFVGEPIDPSRIDVLALGDLWPSARAVDRRHDADPERRLAAETARAVIALGKEMEPVFRGRACAEYLDLLSQEIEGKPVGEISVHMDHVWDQASFALRRCIELSFDALIEAVRRFLAAATWSARPHLALALARMAGEATVADVESKLALEFAGSPILLGEIRMLLEFDIAAHIAAADEIAKHGPTSAIDGSRHSLADVVPDTAASAALRQATAHLRRIHAGELAYAPDKAFTLADSAAIARAVRAALERDEPWLASLLDELFRKASLAPTAAKTMPSQSVSIALGHAIEAYPTPESVGSLRSMLRDIRHAGVQKKLERNLKGAERGLAARPDIALRMPLEQTVSKPQLLTLVRCLEASLALGLTMDYGDWCSRLAIHPQIRTLTGALVWRLSEGAGESVSVLPVLKRDDVRFQDVAGASVTATIGQRLTLWHPAEVTEDERAAWRGRLADLRLKQPFRQVFREHYSVQADEPSATETAIFADHVVSITPLLGLARREGWKLGYDHVMRSFGAWSAQLRLADHIYPGLSGSTVTDNVLISTAKGGKLRSVRLDEVPVATLSEILRAVDLLVSTSGFALADDMDEPRQQRLQTLAESSLGTMMEMRKQALQHALGGLDGMAGLNFDRRHIRLGPYSVHLSTGRVSREGEPVTIDLPQKASLGAVPWLPYDEKLLELICYTTIEIAKRLRA